MGHRVPAVGILPDCLLSGLSYLVTHLFKLLSRRRGAEGTSLMMAKTLMFWLRKHVLNHVPELLPFHRYVKTRPVCTSFYLQPSRRDQNGETNYRCMSRAVS